MEELRIKPEFQALLPALSENEYQQLKENLLLNGCREPLVTWEGVILDGHNRYKICTENRIPFKTEERPFTDEEEAMQWILINQFGRRNLTVVQRGELALKLTPVMQRRAEKRCRQNAGRTLKEKTCQNSDRI